MLVIFDDHQMRALSITGCSARLIEKSRNTTKTASSIRRSANPIETGRLSGLSGYGIVDVPRCQIIRDVRDSPDATLVTWTMVTTPP
jgi:hypothetical protein